MRRSTLLTDVDSTQPLDFGHQHAQGLVGMWKVLPQYTGGTTLRDLSLYRNDGTLTSMDPGTDWVAGRDGFGALEFLEASTDWVSIPDADHLSFGDASTDSSFTAMGWIYPSNTTCPLIGKGSNAAREWYLITDSTNHMLLRCFDNNSSDFISIKTSAAITLNVWQHWAATYDGSGASSGINVFVNGQNPAETTEDAGSYTAMHNQSAGAAIGRVTVDSSAYTTGQIDDTRVYNRALSPAEIAAIYEDTLTGRYDLLRRVSRRTFSIPAAVTPTTTTAGRVRRKYRRKATLLTDVDSTQPLDVQHPHASGLVGMWKVLPQYTGGTTLRDLSLYRNDGTLENISPPEDWVAGRDGLGALDLAGSNDRINVAGLLGEAVDNTKCTIMGWVKTDTVSVYHEMLGFGDASEITGARFGQNGTKIHGAVRINGTWKWRVNTTSEYLSVGVWTHIAMIHDGVEPHFYVNGDEKSLTYVVGTDKTAWLPDDPDWDTAHIGVLYWNGAYSEYWDGQIDDVRYYNRALPASEIADIYEDTLTGRYDLLRRVSRRTFSIPGAAPGGELYWMWARQTGAQIIGGGVA